MGFKGCAHSSRDASCDPQVGHSGCQMVRPGVARVYYMCRGTTSGGHTRGDWGDRRAPTPIHKLVTATPPTQSTQQERARGSFLA